MINRLSAAVSADYAYKPWKHVDIILLDGV